MNIQRELEIYHIFPNYICRERERERERERDNMSLTGF